MHGVVQGREEEEDRVRLDGDRLPLLLLWRATIVLVFDGER